MSLTYTTRARPRTVIGTLTGLVVVLLGWLFYFTNGFYSSGIFLAGVMMIPSGLVIIGWSISSQNEMPLNTGNRPFSEVRPEPKNSQSI